MYKYTVLRGGVAIKDSYFQTFANIKPYWNVFLKLSF